MEEGIVAEDELLTVVVSRDELGGYGMKVSGDKPVYVQSVKEHGAAWRAGIRAGDRIFKVDNINVHRATHLDVVNMIKSKQSTTLTVHQQKLRTPITAPVPVDSGQMHQLSVDKLNTLQLMFEKEQKHVRELRQEVQKVPDVRKQAEIDAGEKRCSKIQHDIEIITANLPDALRNQPAPSTPRLNSRRSLDKPNNISPPTNTTSFLSALPRSLSNLTNQSIRNFRQSKTKSQENQPPIQRQNSDKRRPVIPTTCLDNNPPPLPPRSSERPKRMPLTPPVNADHPRQFRRSSHSLDGECEIQPNSIALQMSYPLVNQPPTPVQTDNRTNVPIIHKRSQSSPEHLEHGLSRSSMDISELGTPPPGTPPPPYAHNTMPCTDPQRAIISMEEDDMPNSDNSCTSGLFSNLRTVRESNAKSTVLLNWLLGERRCPSALLLLILTDGYLSSTGVNTETLRRWAFEILSTFIMPGSVLQLAGADENMSNEIERIIANPDEKEDILLSVFRKSRALGKEILSSQLIEFQGKRRLGLAELYAPKDDVLIKCHHDKQQEQQVCERLLCDLLTSASNSPQAQQALVPALVTVAQLFKCRPSMITNACGGNRGSFLMREKPYKQRLKQLNKQQMQSIVRGHRLRLSSVCSFLPCHCCDRPLAGIAPQAAICPDCNLRVHRSCARSIEEPCCLDSEHHNNRISRFMERIHNNNQLMTQDSAEKKRKSTGTSHFLNMERSYRRMEDEPVCETANVVTTVERRNESDESLYESADCTSDALVSDDAGTLTTTPAMSKESLKIAVTDEESELKPKKGHRKAMSLSNPIEMMRNLGDEWIESAKREMGSDKLKSRESLISEEGDTKLKLDNAKKGDKSQAISRKNSADDKSRKTSRASVSALNFLRRKKTPVPSVKTDDSKYTTDEILSYTKFFLEEEKRHTTLNGENSESEEDLKKDKKRSRELTRQTSRSKLKNRGKSQSVKVNTLRKSHSGTLKKNKKKSKTPLNRSRQASIVDTGPLLQKNTSLLKSSAWFVDQGEPRREGSTDEPSAPDASLDTSDSKETLKDSWRAAPPSGRGVNRAESCRERDAPRRGKHRNASDPNRLTAHNNNDLEPGATAAPSGSSSSSSLSSKSNESNTVCAEQPAIQSDVSDEEEPLAQQWAESVPPNVLSQLGLAPRLMKRQEVIHELIVSEGSHVRWLSVLERVFIRPLTRLPTLLPADDLRALVPNLPHVKDKHLKLYLDLKAARTPDDYVVKVGPIADAILNHLGAPEYSSCLSLWCCGHRSGLDLLRMRRRKNKDLANWIAAKEQSPQCQRLQLQDLLACVWQRLTKYQLLLESILKTYSVSEGDSDSEKSLVEKALLTARNVLHTVDQAVRAHDNEHILRQIVSKLEVRVGVSGEWEDLLSWERERESSLSLRTQGDLSIRGTDAKKTTVTALLFEDTLVLLHREGDKYILKPIPQGSQQTALSPVIKLDKVLFRPNAAVRNCFFLMNINGVQMHELSASTNQEYQNWVKLIQESPLAKLDTEMKPLPVRSVDSNSGTNVSRNPSDASEKSTDEEKSQNNENTAKEQDSGLNGNKDEQSWSACTVGRVSLVPCSVCDVVTTNPPAITEYAQTVHTHAEQLRRLDTTIASALTAKCELVARLLDVPISNYMDIADIAIMDLASNQDSPNPRHELHSILLAAHAQVHQLTSIISSSLSMEVNNLSRSRTGLCDACKRDGHTVPKPPIRTSSIDQTDRSTNQSADKENSFDMLNELDRTRESCTTEHINEPCPCVCALCVRVSPLVLDIQSAISQAVVHVANNERDARYNRVIRDRGDRDRHMRYHTNDETTPSVEHSSDTIPDQPTNGG